MMVFQQFKVILLGILAVLRRALCCFSRRRKPSVSEEMYYHNINVVVDNNYSNQPATATTASGQHPERDWNSWDDSPRTVQEHIDQYRQRMAKAPTPPAQPETDFFTELTPEIKPQLKFYLGENTNVAPTDFSRLEAKTDVPITVNADLEDWVDEETGGWDELDTEQTKQIIREKRREIRTQRQKAIRASGPEGQDMQGIGATRLNGSLGFSHARS